MPAGAFQLVRGGEHAYGSHWGVAADQRGHAVDLLPTRVDHVGVLGLIGDDAGAGRTEAREPGVLRRTDELHERQDLTASRRLLAGERRQLRLRIELAIGSPHASHVVAAVRPRVPQACVVGAARLDEREGAVAGDQARIGARQRGLPRRVRRDYEQMPPGALTTVR